MGKVDCFSSAELKHRIYCAFSLTISCVRTEVDPTVEDMAMLTAALTDSVIENTNTPPNLSALTARKFSKCKHELLIFYVSFFFLD